MRKIFVSVSTEKVGSECSTEIEVEDGATEEEIAAEAREAMFEMIEWTWRTT